MFPFHPFQSQSFNFPITISSQTLSSPITDIESESKSVSGDLCESFEGLFSKEVEESTMSSEWSRKQVAAPSKLGNTGQNQLGQKKTNQNQTEKQGVIENGTFFDQIHKQIKEKRAGTVQKTSDEQTEDKIELETVQSDRILLQQKRNKLLKYRSLLPHPCYTKLPAQLLNLLSISSKIDSYLSTKKPSLFTDNLYNIFKSIFSQEQMSSIWSDVKKLIFIARDHYRVRIDPLKNLCLAMGDGKLEDRRVKLRKLIGEYYSSHKHVYEQEGVPEAYVEPVKTTRFYPENLNLLPEFACKKLSKKYIGRLQQTVRNKQNKIQQIELKCQSCAPITPSHSGQSLPDPSELEQFCEAVASIYSQKKVAHMYKSSLIEHVRKCTVFSLQKIFFFIRYITQEELFFEVTTKAECKIFGLIVKERETLIQGLKQKRAF